MDTISAPAMIPRPMDMTCRRETDVELGFLKGPSPEMKMLLRPVRNQEENIYATSPKMLKNLLFWQFS
jgi:hypothetical protein